METEQERACQGQQHPQQDDDGLPAGEPESKPPLDADADIDVNSDPFRALVLPLLSVVVGHWWYLSGPIGPRPRPCGTWRSGVAARRSRVDSSTRCAARRLKIGRCRHHKNPPGVDDPG